MLKLVGLPFAYILLYSFILLLLRTVRYASKFDSCTYIHATEVGFLTCMTSGFPVKFFGEIRLLNKNVGIDKESKLGCTN